MSLSAPIIRAKRNDPDSTITAAQIGIMSNSDGQNYIVTSGLEAGQKIVTEGVSKLREGQKISPVEQK